MKTYDNTLNEAMGHPMWVPGYVVILDEPQGLCVNFKPKGDEIEVDKYTIVSDDGGEFYKYLDGAKIAIVREWDDDCEPQDNYIWRSEAEFNEWLEEMIGEE